MIQGNMAEGKTVKEGEEAILKELDLLVTNGVTESELEKVKNKKETIFTYSETEVLTKAMNLAYYEYLGDADLINTEMEKFREVTIDDINTVSREIFRLDNQSVLYYLKENKA